MKPYTLVIIDMQTGFNETSADPELVKNVLRAIRKAKKDKAAIVTVIYSGYGRTLYPITKELKGYAKRASVRKYDDNGGPEITGTITRRGFPREIRVCGVNTDACVRETVESLLDRNHPITVLARSCNCGTQGSHKGGLRSMVRRGAKVLPRPVYQLLHRQLGAARGRAAR